MRRRIVPSRFRRGCFAVPGRGRAMPPGSRTDAADAGPPAFRPRRAALSDSCRTGGCGGRRNFREVTMREIGHFIGGKEVKGTSGRFGNVYDPNTGEVQARVAFAKHAEVEHAIVLAEAAQPAWAATNPQRRARVLFRFLELAQQE